jgi:hypothetical protein
VVIDSLWELQRLAHIAAELHRRVGVSLRLDVGVAPKTHPGLVTSGDAKAGISMADAFAAFSQALPRGLAGHQHRAAPAGRPRRPRLPRPRRRGLRRAGPAHRHRRRLRHPLRRHAAERLPSVVPQLPDAGRLRRRRLRRAARPSRRRGGVHRAGPLPGGERRRAAEPRGEPQEQAAGLGQRGRRKRGGDGPRRLGGGPRIHVRGSRRIGCGPHDACRRWSRSR